MLESSQTMHAFCPPHTAPRDLRHLFKDRIDGRFIAYQGGEIDGIPIPQFTTASSSARSSSPSSDTEDAEKELLEELEALHLGSRVGLEDAGTIRTTTTRVERAGVTHLVHHWAMQGHTAVRLRPSCLLRRAHHSDYIHSCRTFFSIHGTGERR